MITSSDLSDSAKIRRGYSAPAWWYDVRGFFIIHLAHQDQILRLARFFAVNGSSQHLEIAVGSGSLLAITLLVRRWIYRLPLPRGVGIDFAPAMLNGAIRRLGHLRNWRFQLADAAHLPFPDQEFATANMVNALHCMPDAPGAISEAYRVLHPGGTLALNVVLVPRGKRWRRRIAERMYQWGMRKGLLVRPYEESEVRQLFLSHGFEISRTAIHGNDLYLIVQKPSRT
jgi:ubiquinone/menaquinone biosynthesis C-methylase UbiE